MPKEFEGESIDWAEQTFYSADTFPFLFEDERWTEIKFDEDNQMNRELQTLEGEEIKNIEFERLEDFTGELTFVSFIPQKDSSYDLVAEFTAVVIYGKLDKVVTVTAKKLDNDKRKEAVAELSSRVKASIETSNKWWFKPYSVYSVLLRGIAMVILFIWQIPAYLFDWLIRKITPEVK